MPAALGRFACGYAPIMLVLYAVSTNDTKWLVGGIILTASLSGLLLVASPITILAPAPLHLAIGLWSISYLYLLVMPIVYSVGYIALRNNEWFPMVTSGIYVVLVGLSVWYFIASWEYGVRFQSRDYTSIVAIQNLLIVALIGYALIMSFQKNNYWSKLSFLLLICWLSWCAFPLLGELP